MIAYFVKIIFIRSYKYLLLAFCSLVIGAFLFGAVVSLSRSLSSYFIEEGKTLIGADVVMNSGNPIDSTDEFFADLRTRGHTVTTQYGVQAVFRTASSTSSVAASIRAVEPSFPLYGKMEIEGELPFIVGEHRLYAEKTFLDKLGLTVGDSVFLGDTSFTIAGIIRKEPDAVSVGVSFSPRVLLSQDDLLTSGIDLTQSRISYTVFVKEDATNPFSKDQLAELKAYAQENTLRFDDARDGPNNFVRGLSSVSDFAGIVLAIALFLVAVNIGANLAYILARFKKTIALLKTYGATTMQIQSVYSIILGAIGFVAGALGACVGGYSVTNVLPMLSEYIAGEISATPLVPVLLIGGVSGVLLTLIASVPFFYSLRSVTPKQLLANVVVDSPRKHLYTFLAYLPLPLFLGVLLYGISSSVTLAVYAVGALVVLFSLYCVISYSIIAYLYSVRRYTSFLFSSIVSFLKWRGLETVVTSASIMTALSGVFIVAAIEENIVHNIQQTITKSAPALYLVDITPSQLEEVKKIAGPTFIEYPVVRGRLLSINDRDLTQSSDRGITREFNMTYRNTLIRGESVATGVWHGDSEAQGAVSFEQSFGEEVGGVAIGDTVTVFVQGLTVQARVTSIHEADKSQGTPFFFMVFSPDVLEDFPTTYFGTVEGGTETEKDIETQLGAKFPNIIPIQTSKILETVNTILGTIVLVVKSIGIPSIILGLMLVLVMTGQSLYERKGDVLVLRVFGMKTSTIAILFCAEAGALILIATGISYGIAHVIAYLLNTYLFSFSLFTFAVMPLYTSVGILFVTVLFSYYIAFTLVKTPLKKLLAEK